MRPQAIYLALKDWDKPDKMRVEVMHHGVSRMAMRTHALQHNLRRWRGTRATGSTIAEGYRTCKGGSICLRGGEEPERIRNVRFSGYMRKPDSLTRIL